MRGRELLGGVRVGVGELEEQTDLQSRFDFFHFPFSLSPLKFPCTFSSFGILQNDKSSPERDCSKSGTLTDKVSTAMMGFDGFGILSDGIIASPNPLQWVCVCICVCVGARE